MAVFTLNSLIRGGSLQTFIFRITSGTSTSVQTDLLQNICIRYAPASSEVYFRIRCGNTLCAHMVSVKYKASDDGMPCHIKMWGLSVCSCGLLNIRPQLTGCLVILRCGDSLCAHVVC